MAVVAKPAQPKAKAVDLSEAAAAAFIAKGGSTPPTSATQAPSKPRRPKLPGEAQHPLKFPADSDLFDRLERARAGSVVKLPRNTWILQAIAEKLARDAG